MKLTLSIILAGMLAIFQLQQAAADLPGTLTVGISGDKCNHDNGATMKAQSPIYASMVEAISEITGEDYDELMHEATFTTNRDDDCGLRLKMSQDFMDEVVSTEHRELFDCGRKDDCGGAWWCCQICGWGCRRRLDLLENAAEVSGRSLDDIADSICDYIKAKFEEGKGMGCLKTGYIQSCELVL